MQLLRPLEWFLTETVVLLGTSDDPQSLYQSPVHVTAEKDTTDYKLQQLLLDQRIYLDLPELGAQGLAKVTAIDPCPALNAAESGRRLVTGTFRHAAANVIDVQVGSETEPFGCTDNHPFWSVDREQFVEAGQLQIGENLQSADGTIVQVTRITPRRGPPVDVFNFEVDVDHVYHVGTTGVLVHNACHHTIPKYLGGFRNQPRTNTPDAIHRQLHSMLRERWRQLGFPPEGGVTGSRDAWRSFMENNSGAQRQALDELLDVTRQIDRQHGTNLLSGLWQNLMNGQFRVH